MTYAPLVRREDGALPANTVSALLAEADGTLWVGTLGGGLRRVEVRASACVAMILLRRYWRATGVQFGE
jgi:hypothetical protein